MIDSKNPGAVAAGRGKTENHGRNQIMTSITENNETRNTDPYAWMCTEPLCHEYGASHEHDAGFIAPEDITHTFVEINGRYGFSVTLERPWDGSWRGTHYLEVAHAESPLDLGAIEQFTAVSKLVDLAAATLNQVEGRTDVPKIHSSGATSYGVGRADGVPTVALEMESEDGTTSIVDHLSPAAARLVAGRLVEMAEKAEGEVTS